MSIYSFTLAAMTAFVCATSVSAVTAAVVGVIPTAPSPGDSYNSGSPCPIQFTIDASKTWTNMSIDLMSGSNLDMVTVTNVVSGADGTTGSGMLSWVLPDVTPNAAIYFFQFTNNGANPTWTTRFTIASALGKSTTPTNPTQPGGQAVPWGTGALLAVDNTTTTTTSLATSITAAPTNVVTSYIVVNTTLPQSTMTTSVTRTSSSTAPVATVTVRSSASKKMVGVTSIFASFLALTFA